MNNNNHKGEVLESLDSLLKSVGEKIGILEALDKDSSCSGSHDLHDQLTSLFTAHNSLEQCVERSKLVVQYSANIAPQ
jgi:hypothetical protein